MSYVQGTKVLVTGRFKDPDTGLLFDPADVILTHWPIGGDPLAPVVLKYSLNQVAKLTTDPKTGSATPQGLYRGVIDTSTAVFADTDRQADWPYEFEGTGALAIVTKGTLRIRKR